MSIPEKLTSKMYSCTYFGIAGGYILVPQMIKSQCVQAGFFFFFPLRRESYSKIWSEIVNLLTLKSMQDMITSYFQQNYKGDKLHKCVI